MAVLYKYLPPERLDVLERRSMRLSQPSALNDPHDALLALRSRLEEYGGVERVRADDFLVERVYARQFREDLGRQLGVLCFSANPCVHLMWSHYALNHTGYLLHVDPEHAFFDRELIWKSSPYWVEHRYIGLPHPSPVSYSGERKVYYSEDGVPWDVLFQKSHHWMYEEEHRSVMNLADANVLEQTKNDPWPVYLIDLPLGLISGATLGLDASEETVTRVTVACAEMRVPVYRIIPDHLTYNLRSVPLDAVK